MKRKELSLGLSVGILVTLIGAAIASSAIAQQVTTKWEYLTFKYSQNQVLDAMYDVDAEVSRYETIDTSDLEYMVAFSTDLLGSCTVTGELGIYFDTEAQKCVGKNFKGQTYFMNLLGSDGWEMISATNTSTEYSFNLDMIFKRPLN